MAKVAKSEFSEEKWNKKRVVFAVLIFLILIIGGLELKSYILGSNGPSPSYDVDVRGAGVSPVPSVSLPSAQNISQEALQNLDEIKNEINNIDVVDLANSSPQVQKVLNDIKALPSVPGKQARDACLRLCSSL